MFCNQCEQVAKGGCTTMGVCGKQPEVSDLQDLLIHALQGLSLYAVEGRKAGVTDAQIIQALHPSAAVLGYPRDKAWQWLRAYEDHVRGWYAGPVGWFERDRAQFAVAIRCAMVASTQLHFYAGAGLVPASRPLEEWEEVENKMRFFQEILKG